jgi:hypothetical protein
MASQQLYQIGSESAASLKTPSERHADIITQCDFLVNAAKSRFGRNIQVLRTIPSTIALDKFFEDLQFSVLYHDAEPAETSNTVIDVHIKEYVNRSSEEKDETVTHVSRPGSITQGNRYHFIPISGLTFNFGKDIGAQIVGLAAIGGNLGVKEDSTVSNQHHQLASNFCFEYKQEEKIPVPPNRKVKVKMTTSTIKYEMRYTLEFKIPSSRFVNVTYFNQFQQFLCGLCRSCRPVYAADILQDLPNFREENGWCFFQQVGILTWIGENCNVDKTEEPILVGITL